MRALFLLLLLCCPLLLTAQVDSMQVAPTEEVDTLAAAADSLITALSPEANTAEAEEESIQQSITDVISISKVVWAILLLIGSWVVIRFTSRILEILAERSTSYRITIKSFIPVIKIAGWLTAAFVVVAGIFKPPAATVLAFSASIGVAVGFASQDILKNIFGGIMILFDRPFKSGDKIDVGGYYGEVVEIGLRSTRIVTPDDNLVSIPNSEIMNSSVSNANAGESNCQVVAEIYLPINADTTKCRLIATQAAKVSKYVYLNKPITVVFANEFKDHQSLLKMKIKAYVLDIRDEFKFKSEMTETTIKKLLEEKVLNPDGQSTEHRGFT